VTVDIERVRVKDRALTQQLQVYSLAFSKLSEKAECRVQTAKERQ